MQKKKTRHVWIYFKLLKLENNVKLGNTENYSFVVSTNAIQNHDVNRKNNYFAIYS